MEHPSIEGDLEVHSYDDDGNAFSTWSLFPFYLLSFTLLSFLFPAFFLLFLSALLLLQFARCTERGNREISTADHITKNPKSVIFLVCVSFGLWTISTKCPHNYVCDMYVMLTNRAIHRPGGRPNSSSWPGQTDSCKLQLCAAAKQTPKQTEIFMPTLLPTDKSIRRSRKKESTNSS